MAGRVDRRTMVVVFFAALALCALVTKSHVAGWNDGSRIATVDALAAGRTFEIDGSPFAVGLGDEIRFKGRTYSDKPPLLAVLGAGVALGLAPLGISLRHTPGLAIYLVTLLTVGVWFALGCCYAYALQRLLGFPQRVAVAVAALTGAATLALPYATVLTNHVPCGASALAACCHLLRARDGGGSKHVALGGLFLGLCYAFDAAGATFAIAGAVLLWGRPVRQWLLCAAAGLPLVLLQVAYNLSISGSVVPTVFNLGVWSDPSLPLHAESAQVLRWFSPAEYLGFAVSLLVGSRGLFSFTPLMLVAAYGFGLMWRTPRMRVVALAALSTAAAFFLLIVFLQNDAHARNFGERRYVDLFFLLCVALGPALAAVRGPLAPAAVRAAVVLSVAIAALGTVAPFAGGPGESGFAFGSAEFAALLRRSPVQAALDVLLLFGLIAFVLRLVGRALGAANASAAVTAEVRQRA